MIQKLSNMHLGCPHHSAVLLVAITYITPFTSLQMPSQALADRDFDDSIIISLQLIINFE